MSDKALFVLFGLAIGTIIIATDILPESGEALIERYRTEAHLCHQAGPVAVALKDDACKALARTERELNWVYGLSSVTEADRIKAKE